MVRVSERELQNKFNNNEGGYNTRMDTLSIECVYDRPASLQSGQAAGTTSKIFKFKENGQTVMSSEIDLKIRFH